MQEDTYKIIAWRLDQALNLIKKKEARGAHEMIETIYLLTHKRLPEEIGEELETIDKRIFTYNKDPQEFTDIMVSIKSLFK